MSAFFSGYFNKGEINTPTPIYTPKQFRNTFGVATDDNYNDWYQVYNYLQYSGEILINRTTSSDIMNSFVGYPYPDTETIIYNELDFYEKLPQLTTVSGNYMKFIAKTPGSWGNDIKIAVITLLEWERNVEVYNGLYAKTLISFMNKDEYSVLVFRNNVLLESHTVKWNTFTKLNADSVYIYVVENVIDPTQYIDGNLKWFDGSYPDGFDDVYDGNDPYNYVPVVFGDSILSLYGGYEVAPSASDVYDAYMEVQSKEDYTFNVIIGNERNNIGAIDLAELRRDSIAFIGVPNIESADIEEYRNTLGVSMYTSLIAEYKQMLDPFSNKNRWVNIAGDIAGLKSKSNDESAEWFASAGLTRGIILNVLKMKYKPAQSQRDYWYDKSINSVLYMNSWYLGGQKTLVSESSSFDRVNTRALFNELERQIEHDVLYSTFVYNDYYTRNKIVSMINPYLKSVKYSRGISNYQVVCDETNNTPDVISRNSLIIDVFVKPTYVAETIHLTYTLDDNSFTTTVN